MISKLSHLTSSPFTRADLNFFKLDQVTDGVFQLYISVTVLSLLKISEKTIRNGVCINRAGRSTHWISLMAYGKLWIRFDSIPANTLHRHNLPTDSQLMYEKLKGSEQFKEEFYKDAQFLEIYNSLEYAYLNWFPSYITQAKKYFQRENVQIRYAKNAALISQVIKLTELDFPPEVIFSCYKKLAIKEVSNLTGLVFTTDWSGSFWRKIKQARSEGVVNALLHKSLAISKPDRRKGSEAIDSHIRMLLRHSARLPLPKILKRVKKKFNVDLSLSYIKKISCRPETKNLTSFDANGYFHSRANSMPKLRRELASKPGELFQADFYTVQFVVRKADGNIGSMISYFVMDIYSRKIVGWAIGSEMDEHIALNAFKNAFISCGFLPESISVDGDLYYKRADFVSFIDTLKDLGVIWLEGDPYKPTVRAEIESFFSKYQKVYCSDKKFFKGEDVKSKNERGNPSEELTKRYWNMKSQLPTPSDLQVEMRKMVRAYNHQHDED